MVKEIVDLIYWFDLLQNVRFKFDIAWFVLWSLAPKEVSVLLHTYVVVLTLVTHNPCNRRYLLHLWLCLSTTWAIVLKPAINNPHHKKVPSGYTIFLRWWHFFYYCDQLQKKWVLFKMQQGKPLALKYLRRFPIDICAKHTQWGFQVNNRQ